MAAWQPGRQAGAAAVETTADQRCTASQPASQPAQAGSAGRPRARPHLVCPVGPIGAKGVVCIQPLLAQPLKQVAQHGIPHRLGVRHRRLQQKGGVTVMVQRGGAGQAEVGEQHAATCHTLG
jgi:hypothetical protein